MKIIAPLFIFLLGIIASFTNGIPDRDPPPAPRLYSTDRSPLGGGAGGPASSFANHAYTLTVGGGGGSSGNETRIIYSCTKNYDCLRTQ